MINLKRIGAGLMALVASILVALAIGGATPANAALSNCPAGTTCIWNGPNYTGQMWVLSYSGLGGPFVCNLLGSAWKQDVSYHVGFGGGHGLGVWTNNDSMGPCNVGILGSWTPNSSATLVPGNGSAYKQVAEVEIY